ncbi:MAG: class II fructose-bisphosphate aldolase [Clostridiales bacterium]|jgi:fructose-bisphosphate aldolase class II|nr:class II fructose-bisphosphate aldolase [Clostridiales bacterium]
MALCSLKELLYRAEKQDRAVEAFNVGSMEMLMGAVLAAEEAGSPIVLQIAEKRLKFSPLELMGPMMVSAARRSAVDMAVQLDHAASFPVMEMAADMGFTSIMFDGSQLSLADNIRETSKIAAWARNRGLSLEAEIGVLGGSEGGPEGRALRTDPGDAAEFAEKTGCDALAISFGNAHGHYRGKPKLDFGALKGVSERAAGAPLVLHGGSGIPAEDFQKAIALGIRKINIATAVTDAEVEGAKRYLEGAESRGSGSGSGSGSGGGADYFGMNEAIVGAVRAAVAEHIGIFGGNAPISYNSSTGRATRA